MRRLIISALLLLGIGFGVLAYAFGQARADPVVRRATIALPDWPRGAASVRVVLLSDIHIGSLAMDAGRLTRIVAQVNALRPDLVLIAGDFVYGHDPRRGVRFAAELGTPLAGLRSRLGTIAVLGNHDWWNGEPAVRAQLARAGIAVVENGAVTRWPLAIAGIGDEYTDHDRIGAAMAAVRRLPGARLVLTHSPDLVPRLPPDARLVLAGHTHCGQVSLLGWTPGPQPYAPRYRCGIIREHGRAIVVGAGVGASVAPIRFGVPPDLWLLTLGPAAA
ncbi:hypothetical protein SAMN06297144_0779 [Sphingomonas guangdongensis]|uniref:Calcineurin-like phosphoesterase domain-containing protein n=1 Tax=Sphingomonas guangdongensis TaxID=1141890 RepID=A0A285QD64_9SPHN|nr:metallophosphoesterase [Sphingomonas guangdongensis]SOB79880.1 hypothetical protein SAMN06297144_0779 [Sphingomonas guangdongensis]